MMAVTVFSSMAAPFPTLYPLSCGSPICVELDRTAIGLDKRYHGVTQHESSAEYY